MRRILALFLSVMLCFSLLPLSVSAASAGDYPLLAGNFNSGATENGPYNTVYYTPSQDQTIQAITTYHWNGGKGSAPGSISIYMAFSGDPVGTYRAYGRAGYNNAPNVYWDCFPNVVLKAGETYIIEDSDPWTWSTNAASDYVGFIELRGKAVSANAGNGPNGSKCSSWAVAELNTASSLGLIPGCLKGANLTRSITRAEFAAVCVQVYQYMSGKTASAAGAPFTDTRDSEVLKAYALGIVNGTSATTFSPNDLLTREQAATMLTRAYKKVAIPGWTLANDSAYTLSFAMPPRFADDASISDYARTSVYFMAANGILNGMGENKFVPKGTAIVSGNKVSSNASREQAVVISARMAQKLDTTNPQYTGPSSGGSGTIGATGKISNSVLTLDFGSSNQGTFSGEQASVTSPGCPISDCYAIGVSNAANANVTLSLSLTGSVPAGMSPCVRVGVPYRNQSGQSGILWDLLPATVSNGEATATLNFARYRELPENVCSSGGTAGLSANFAAVSLPDAPAVTSSSVRVYVSTEYSLSTRSTHFRLNVCDAQLLGGKLGMNEDDCDRVLDDLERIFQTYQGSGFQATRDFQKYPMNVNITALGDNVDGYYCGSVFGIQYGSIELNSRDFGVGYFRDGASSALVSGYQENYCTFAHELFHYFQNEYVNAFVDNVFRNDLWFHEATAMYYEDVLSRKNNMRSTETDTYKNYAMDIYSGILPTKSTQETGYGRRPYAQYLEECLGANTIRTLYSASGNHSIRELLPYAGKSLSEQAQDFYVKLVTTNRLRASYADPWTIYNTADKDFHSPAKIDSSKNYLTTLTVDGTKASSQQSIGVYGYGASFMKVIPQNLPASTKSITIRSENKNEKLTVMTFSGNSYDSLKVLCTNADQCSVPVNGDKILVMLVDTSGSKTTASVTATPVSGGYFPKGTEDNLPSSFRGTVSYTDAGGNRVSQSATATLSLSESYGTVQVSAGSFRLTVSGAYNPGSGTISGSSGSACISSGSPFADADEAGPFSAQALGCDLSVFSSGADGAVFQGTSVGGIIITEYSAP